jgi:hypothetical protein
MRYATAVAFRQALDDRLKAEAAKTGLGVARLRKRVAFELFLRRLVAVAPDRWVLKGALALDFRFDSTTRPTRDMDLGRDDDEDAAVEDLTAAQQLELDDFFTFVVRRPDALDDTDDFRAIRFHVTASLAGHVFDQFVVDVGFADSISWTPDAIETSDLLSFAGIERVRVPALPLPQHIAEKVHRRDAAVRRDRTGEHPTEGPGRHPPDRRVGAARRRVSAQGPRNHLRTARTAAAAFGPAGAACRLARGVRPTGCGSGCRAGARQGVLRGRRVSRSNPRQPHPWRMGPPAADMGL